MGRVGVGQKRSCGCADIRDLSVLMGVVLRCKTVSCTCTHIVHAFLLHSHTYFMHPLLYVLRCSILHVDLQSQGTSMCYCAFWSSRLPFGLWRRNGKVRAVCGNLSFLCSLHGNLFQSDGYPSHCQAKQPLSVWMLTGRAGCLFLQVKRKESTKTTKLPRSIHVWWIVVANDGDEVCKKQLRDSFRKNFPNPWSKATNNEWKIAIFAAFFPAEPRMSVILLAELLHDTNAIPGCQWRCSQVVKTGFLV